MKKHFLLLLLMLFGSISLALAQAGQLTGTIKDDKGEALPGVTVLLKGTTTGTTTDVNGTYTLPIPEGTKNATLRFSFIGYVSQEVAVGKRTDISVSLINDTQALDDVVVIGFQSIDRKDVTGSVSSVSAQQIKDIPVNSAAEALAGRLAGVQVTASEGSPGADIRIRVRGGGSITQDNSPLYVVDGVQVENALSVLSPQDIASVDVLKDASATAIYGARGANGVVIITTKNGREGRLSVAYNGFIGVRKIARTLDVLKPNDYLEWSYERSAQAGSVGLAAFKSRFGARNYNSDTLNQYKNAPFIDWQDRVFGGNALYQTHNVSVSGGGAGTTFNLSLTNNQEDGIQLGSGYVRNLINFRFDHKANDKFRLGFNFRFNDQVIRGNGTSSSGSTTTSRLRSAVTYLPIDAVLANGLSPGDEVVDEDFFATSNQLINPIVAIDNEYRRDRRRLFNTSGYASYSFTKNLTVRSTVGFDNNNNRVETFYGLQSPNVRALGGSPIAAIALSTPITFNNSNVISYRYTTGKHVVDGVLGHEIYIQQAQTLGIQTNYLPSNITPEKAINNINQGVLPSATAVQPNPTTGQSVNSRLLSGFARLNYAYNDKYLLTATFRADGSSKFAAGQRTGYFPAASVAWRISSEEFMKQYKTISDLKLRLSYGLSGNNRINDFLYDTYYTSGAQYALVHNIVNGTSTVGLANPNLKWETTASTNVGIDLSLFNNRLQFTTDIYYNKTSDLLLNLSIPATSGYTTQLVNAGATSNRGIEVQVTGTVVQSKSFTWTANANISFNRNRVEDLGGVSALPPQYSGWASTAISADYFVGVGQPVGLMYGYITEGMYTTKDFRGYVGGSGTGAGTGWILRDGVASDAGVIGTGTVSPGQLKLRDVNGDGVVNESDRTVIGNANPKFTGGFNQQFTYKSFDASVFVNFVYGNQIWNDNKIEYTTYLANSEFANGLEIMKDRYRTIDMNTGVAITDAAQLDALNQNATIWSAPRQLIPHSWAVEDGSFLRINNLSLGYSLPKALIQHARLSQLRVYGTINNVYTFTNYTGFDPEVNTRRGTPLTPGVDYAGYPRSRAFLLGVNIGL
ncbi:MAG: SusC/RagA family TonB-linked outer membrane protein [Janthinobacterium lividum]